MCFSWDTWHWRKFRLKDQVQDSPERILVKLREFMEFLFEGRYPDANNEFYRKCTRAYTAAKLKEIKEVYRWIKEKL